MSELTLAGQVGLITGGASGLGKETVIRLSGLGVKAIVAIDLNEFPDDLKNIHNVTCVSNVDVTSEDDIKSVIDKIENEHGRLDFLINCAGIVMMGPVYNFHTGTPHSLDSFRKIIDVNLIGTFNVTRLSIELMAKDVQHEQDPDKLRGCIINVASVAGLDGPTYMLAYGTSKAAIHGMTLSLARDLAPQGIRVNAIAPGLMETPMVTGDAAIESYLECVPCPARLGQPREFAHLVQTILQNHMINGETIRLDAACRIPFRKY